ncbi:MAG TPA: uroporphyrinogen-III C-methyltransferase [Mycobacteriales bacterium]|nr:uroporphyrinogen-III C-methyltransferase [Mycobacteriales bacterium]
MRYPLFLDLTGRRVVVVGGGSVAARRVRDLVAAGAVVTVVAPEVDPRVSEQASVLRRSFVPSDLDDAWLVLACTDVAAVNREVADAAEQRSVWCVRADDASRSSAWRPASSQVEDITLAVSAGGDPTRAAGLRDLLAAHVRAGEVSHRRGRRDGGRVVLVGGGPGNPDLITLRGYRALLDADVVVADRLGPTRLLDLLPPEVTVLDVGKAPGSHVAAQEAINALLVDHARRGSLVVRLKGGDPFIFGRGSEEVEACLAAGVPVEVVPGLTSPVAAATLAGIPLTERGTTAQFTVVSGHVPPGDPRSTVDWALLAAADSTIVLMMAVANLAAIARALVAGGRADATPVAIVTNASMADQQVTITDLAGLTDGSTQVRPPAIVIIGEVVRALSPADEGASRP